RDQRAQAPGRERDQTPQHAPHDRRPHAVEGTEQPVGLALVVRLLGHLALLRQVMLAALAQVGRQAVHHDDALADRAATGLAPQLESPAGVRQGARELLDPPRALPGVWTAP